MAQSAGKIRFEDLGEPVQKLLRTLHGGKGGENVSEEDMVLLEYIGVKDMVKIYQEMSSERGAAAIWEELRAALVARREKAERKSRENNERMKDLEAEREQAEAEAQRLKDEQDAAAADAEKRARKEARRKEKAAARAAAAAEAEREALLEQERLEAEQAEEEEAARLAEEEAAQKRREDRRRRREEKARRLQEEAEALLQEQATEKEKSRRKRNQKREWDDYVASHPLEFAAAAPAVEQVKREEAPGFKAQPLANAELLNRTYTPQCPNCGAKYSKPPPQWECPMCLRKLRQRFQCWQPDDVKNCSVCNTSIGRFTRHHCRNCGRCVCGKCSELKVLIPALGYKDAPVRCCIQCMRDLAPAAVAAAEEKKKKA